MAVKKQGQECRQEVKGSDSRRSKSSGKNVARTVDRRVESVENRLGSE